MRKSQNKGQIGFAALLIAALFLFHSVGHAQGIVRVKPPDLNKDSTVVTNGMVITTNTAVAFHITMYNSSGSDLFLLVFDLSTNNIPASGRAPTLAAVRVPSNSTGGWDWTGVGHNFRNGIIVANSTTPVSLTNGSANCWISVSYDGRKD